MVRGDSLARTPGVRGGELPHGQSEFGSEFGAEHVGGGPADPGGLVQAVHGGQDAGVLGLAASAVGPPVVAGVAGMGGWPLVGGPGSGLVDGRPGMAVIASSILVVSWSIWPPRVSIWSSRLLATKAWWSLNWPVRASTSAACLTRSRPRASSARTFGSRCPATSASRSEERRVG